MAKDWLFGVLVIAFFALSTASKVIELDENTFESSLQNGLWFVEFYTPWCGYCKHLLPIWEDLSDRVEKIQISKIDCSRPNIQAICARHGIRGYPTLRMFYNGAHLEDFEGHRTSHDLKQYVDRFVKQYSEEKETKPEESQEIVIDVKETTPETETKIESVTDEEVKLEILEEEKKEEPIIEKEPEVQVQIEKEPKKIEIQLEKVSEPERKYNLEGKVVDLNSENFDSLTANSPWFLEFFAPWCGHCKNLLPIWEGLAIELRGKANVGKIDCTEEGALCERFSVRAFPTIKFSNYGTMVDYKDTRSINAFVNFSKRLLSPALTHLTWENFKLTKTADSFFIYIYKEGDSLDVIKEISKQFLLSTTFFVTKDPQIQEFYKVQTPALVASQNEQLSFYNQDIKSISLVENWVKEHLNPLVVPLDSSNAAEILSGDKLIVTLLQDASKGIESHKTELISMAINDHKESKNNQKKSQLVFSILDAVKWKAYVSKNYGVETEDLPILIIIDPVSNTYYSTNQQGKKVKIEQKEMSSFIQAVKNGQMEGKSIGGVIRGFLTMVQKKLTPSLLFIHENLILVLVGFVGIMIALLWYLTSEAPPTKNEKAE